MHACLHTHCRTTAPYSTATRSGSRPLMRMGASKTTTGAPCIKPFALQLAAPTRATSGTRSACLLCPNHAVGSVWFCCNCALWRFGLCGYRQCTGMLAAGGGCSCPARFPLTPLTQRPGTKPWVETFSLLPVKTLHKFRCGLTIVLPHLFQHRPHQTCCLPSRCEHWARRSQSMDSQQCEVSLSVCLSVCA